MGDLGNRGEPGKPGRAGSGQAGGQGGEGGRGGSGLPQGAGGHGGIGGAGAPGERGPRGPRGFMSTGAIGYLILTLGVVLGLYLNYQTAEKGEEAQTALCVFKADLETRVDASRKFLLENPDGIPGISAGVIRNGIDNQQKTIDSLDLLDC